MTRLKQYLMKASFASESDKRAALACLDDMESKLDVVEANRCENCGGSGIMSYNPNLNPNSFPAAASAKCSRCAGSGMENERCDGIVIEAELTRCEICKQQCDTIAGLVVHVAKYHGRAQ